MVKAMRTRTHGSRRYPAGTALVCLIRNRECPEALLVQEGLSRADRGNGAEALHIISREVPDLK